MRRALPVLLLLLAACAQPGSGAFYPLGELRLRAFQDGDTLNFEFLGTEVGVATDAMPYVNGTRREQWTRVRNPLDLDPPPDLDPEMDLLGLEWRTDFSGTWSDLLAFYLTQDADTGTLTLHAVGVGIFGGQEEAVYWLDEPTTFIPTLEGWSAATGASPSLTRYDASGRPIDTNGSLTFEFTPRGTDTAFTPLGRFESLALGLKLFLSLPGENGYTVTWNGIAWLHPALGMVRYSVAFQRDIGSDSRLLSLDSVALVNTNIPLPESR